MFVVSCHKLEDMIRKNEHVKIETKIVRVSIKETLHSLKIRTIQNYLPSNDEEQR